MSADTSPLSGYWRRSPVQDHRTSAEILAIADQLAEEMGYVEAGELPAELVLCRYSERQLLGAMAHWGLTSERSWQLRRMRLTGEWPGTKAEYEAWRGSI